MKNCRVVGWDLARWAGMVESRGNRTASGLGEHAEIAAARPGGSMAERAGEYAGELAGYDPAVGVPLYERVLDWLNRLLVAAGFPRPFRKRLAVLVAGLVAGEGARLGAVAEAVHGLAVTPAKAESVARRLLRLLGDSRLDPERLLPALFRALLPTLLRELGAPGAADRLLVVVE